MRKIMYDRTEIVFLRFVVRMEKLLCFLQQGTRAGIVLKCC